MRIVRLWLGVVALAGVLLVGGYGNSRIATLEQENAELRAELDEVDGRMAAYVDVLGKRISASRADPWPLGSSPADVVDRLDAMERSLNGVSAQLSSVSAQASQAVAIAGRARECAQSTGPYRLC